MAVAILDGDIIAFRACSVLGVSPWDPEEKCPLSEGEAKWAASQTVRNWIEAAECDSGIICLTGDANFRKVIEPTYKAGRGEKPETLAAVKAMLAKDFDSRLVEGLEADDLMGIMMTNGRYPNAVAVSIDKDLRTIPGRHFNPVKKEAFVTSPAHADYLWLYQTLIGDVVDGYKGCPGIGPARAEKVLKPPTWASVAAAFAKAGKTEEEAILQARLARILRASDYDKKTKEVILWHPSAPMRLAITAA